MPSLSLWFCYNQRMSNTLNCLKSRIGFTLAELLIALAILGVIATFTIPKILDSGSSSKHNAIVKEAAGFVSAAYQQLKLNSGVDENTVFGDMTPYINFVKVDSTSQIDWYNNLGGPLSCGLGPFRCLLLHNGALLYLSLIHI